MPKCGNKDNQAAILWDDGLIAFHLSEPIREAPLGD